MQSPTHFLQMSLWAMRPFSLRKKANSCFLFLLILGTDIPPSCHPASVRHRTAKYGRVSVSFFFIFCPLHQAFLTSNIFAWGLSYLTAENAVWSCFGIILEQFIWTTLTAPIIPFKIPCHLQHLFPECEQFRDAVTDFILHSQRAFSARKRDVRNPLCSLLITS